MQAVLSLDTLGELDGGAARAIVDQAIAAAVADLDDRGDDGKPRRVKILLTLERTDSGLVIGHVEAAVAVPAWKTAGTVSKVQRRSDGQIGLVFQELAPDDPDQRTIDEAMRQNGGE